MSLAGAASAGSIPYVTEQTFEREILAAELPVLVEFSAVWCGPCKQVEPELLALAGEMAGKLKIVKIDVDKSPMLAQELQIKSVPTFMVVSQGRVAAAQAGAMSRAQMRKFVEPFLPRSESAVRVEEFIKLAQAGRVLPVDVREAASFSRAHLPGAVNVTPAQLEGEIYTLAATGKAPILYCRSGLESKEIAEKFAEEGFPVGFLEGGFLAWELAGQPIERS
jgi:thioredoxin